MRKKIRICSWIISLSAIEYVRDVRVRRVEKKICSIQLRSVELDDFSDKQYIQLCMPMK